MSVQREREGQIMTEERDLDIHVLSAVRTSVNTVPGSCFILTGSYAVEALTGSTLRHDDMDVNIFTPDLPYDLPRIAEAIAGISVKGVGIRTYKQTGDRLEYDIQSNGADSKKLELQFVETAGLVVDDLTEYTLKSGSSRAIKVPVTQIWLDDSRGNKFAFQTKSLSYVIATWAIRISGCAMDPKRPVRESDLEQFKLLLKAQWSSDEVVAAMSHHPQMPTTISEKEILELALGKTISEE